MANRLQRLERSTRYRPVHIGTLLLGGVPPQHDSEFLYYADFARGESAALLQAAGILPAGKTAEVTLAEFQRAGFFLAHILECPAEEAMNDATAIQTLVGQRLPSISVRIRRSLRPKRVALISTFLGPFATVLETSGLGCPILLDNGEPFALDGSAPDHAIARLHAALAGSSVPIR
jgi:hypothetical protein